MEDEVVSVNWSLAEIADTLERGLSEYAAEDRQAQAVRGLDSLNELQFHALIESILRQGGFGVHREQRYPDSRQRRRRTEGERCDLVLTPHDRPLIEEESVATLFAPPQTTAPSDALWLEVKVVAQFTEQGPNPAYASELQAPVRRDVAKLARAEQIHQAAVLLVLFVAEPRTAEHDLTIWEDHCAQRGLPLAARYLRFVNILDRLGNACCSVALFRVKGW